MANKLLLGISLNRATAARWRGGRLTDCAVFDTDEAGIAEFREYAAASGNAPAFVIVDAIEEDYRFETLPHASGSDRAQMVERKLRQYYRASPYCAASLIGRDSTKRRDDQFLFSALTNAEIVTPWLSVLTQCGLPVGGIYLLPMVISGLVSTLGNKISNLLLVAVHPAGIRLAFFHNGTFRLSRLSRSDVSANNRAIIDEISNTQLYLHALRATSLDEPLTVVLLDHADQLQDMPDAIQADNPGINCSRLGRAEIASRLKLDPALIETSSATIYLQLLGARIPGNNLASPAVTAGYRRYQSRRQLLAASAVAATIGVAGAGYNLWEYYWLRDRADDAVHQTARVDAEYQAATLQFPAAPTSADNMRTTTELAARLRATGITPERFLQVIVRALDASPEITLMELGWQNRTAEFEAGGSATGTIPLAPAVPTPGAGTGAARKQSGLVAGRVRDFKGDFRKAIASINVLAERLRQDPAVESVRFVQLPLNVSPTLALSGSTTDKPGQAGGAEFKLIVVLKQPT